jgi:preprotein translocase subunit SecB
LKSGHSSPIQRIGDALVAEGFVTLDEQAKTLGLPRSTTWTILRANHKKSGLSAAIVNRILKSPQLPGPVRAKVLQYVEEKSAGLHVATTSSNSGDLRPAWNRCVDSARTIAIAAQHDDARRARRRLRVLRVLPITDGGDAAPQPQPQAGPALSVLAQYVKDFSFENPSAPASLRAEGQPTMQIGINLAVAQHGGTEYEVTLKLEGKAERTGTVLFAFELSFAGMFRILNVPPEHLQPVLLIECPRLLFPFAREIVSTAVRNGGFAPFLRLRASVCFA